MFYRLPEAQDPFFENIGRDPDAYRGVATPTLIFTGEQDRALLPWQQRKLLDILPNARQIMVPESGHLTYLERPDIFWPAVNAFFQAKAVGFSVSRESLPADSHQPPTTGH